MAFLEDFSWLLHSAVMRSKPGSLLCRYLMSFVEKDLTKSEGWNRALKVIFTSSLRLCLLYLQYMSMAEISQRGVDWITQLFSESEEVKVPSSFFNGRLSFIV